MNLVGFQSYYKTNKDTFSNFMETSFKEFTNSFLLTEEPLTELKILQSVKKWFKDITAKLLEKVKELAMRGIRFLLQFFGFEVNKIKTTGLELFGY